MLLIEWGSEGGILGAEIYLRLSVVILDASLVYSSVVFSLWHFCSFRLLLICFSPELQVAFFREHMYQDNVVIYYSIL